MADDIDRANDQAQAALDRALAAARTCACPQPTVEKVCDDCEDDSGQNGKACEHWPVCLKDWERREVRR